MTDDEHRQWLHDLFNAVNAIGIAVSVARRLLADGEIERAREFLAKAETSCDQCRRLTRHVQESST